MKVVSVSTGIHTKLLLSISFTFSASSKLGEVTCSLNFQSFFWILWGGKVGKPSFVNTASLSLTLAIFGHRDSQVRGELIQVEYDAYVLIKTAADKKKRDLSAGQAKEIKFNSMKSFKFQPFFYLRSEIQVLQYV